MYLQKVENEKNCPQPCQKQKEEQRKGYFQLFVLIWGCSSAGRAPALQAGGQEFDPPHLHQGRRDEKTDVRDNYGLVAQVVRAYA